MNRIAAPKPATFHDDRPSSGGRPKRRRREGGVISIELVVLVPLVVLPLMLFALFAGRLGMMSIREPLLASSTSMRLSESIT